MSENRNNNWFEKNRRKIYFGFLLSLSLIIILGSLAILQGRNKKKIGKTIHPGIERYIRLRENPPLMHKVIYPSSKYMSLTDGLVRREFVVRVDENGFIIPSKKHDRPDLSIVFLGGSSTECLLMDEEKRFPYAVGKILEEKTGKKVNSYNGGVSGNNSLHSIDILLNKVIPMRPDIVALSHNINDLVINLVEGEAYWNKNPYRSPIQIKEEEESYLVKKIKKTYAKIFGKEEQFDEFRHVRGKKLDINRKKMVDEFSSNLQMFIDISKAKKITPVLMTQSNRFKPEPDDFTQNFMKMFERDYDLRYARFKELYDTFSEVIREAARRNNILLVDLARDVPQEREYLYDIVHYSDQGSRLAAEIISAKLLTLDKVLPIHPRAPEWRP